MIAHGPRHKPIAQYDAREVFGHRHLERALLTHHGLHTLVTVLGRIGLTAMLWPRFVAPYRFCITRYPMAMPNLDPRLEGYRILFISDLHTGKTRLSYLQRIINAGLALKPDLILIGGDLIDYHPRSLAPLAKILPQLRAPDGAYTIFGNHDYHEYSWRHIGPRSARRTIHRRLVKIVQESPVRLLRNESVVVRPARGGELQIVGLDEMWCNRFDAAAAFAGTRDDLPTICMIHNPDGCDYVREHGWDWLLSGHSHGGQVNLPVMGPIFVPMAHREWLRGLFSFSRHEQIQNGISPQSSQRAQSHDVSGVTTVPSVNSVVNSAAETRMMFVSTGIGHTKPLRFRVPPEITLFTLTRGNPGTGCA